MKGGVFHPDYELEAYRALAAAFPGRFAAIRSERACGRPRQAIRFGQAIEGLRNDYLEDPVFGLNGMRRTREMVRIPLATNTVVVNFEQLAANVLDTAVDVILLDTTFWGGIRACVKAAGVCETFQLGRGGAFVGRTGHSAGDDAASGRGDPEPLVRRRRALSSPDRRHHRGRPDAIREWRDPRAEGPGLGVELESRKACASTANCTSVWAVIPTTRIRCGPAGLRLCRTIAGPIRRTTALRKYQIRCRTFSICPAVWPW